MDLKWDKNGTWMTRIGRINADQRGEERGFGVQVVRLLANSVTTTSSFR
jgi:hypothetical protein